MLLYVPEADISQSSSVSWLLLSFCLLLCNILSALEMSFQGWSLVFLITIVPAVNWNTKIILICLSVMTMDVVNFEKYLWVIYVSSLENSQFISLAHLLTGFSLGIYFFSSLYILDIYYHEKRIWINIFPKLIYYKVDILTVNSMRKIA